MDPRIQKYLRELQQKISKRTEEGMAKTRNISARMTEALGNGDLATYRKLMDEMDERIREIQSRIYR